MQFISVAENSVHFHSAGSLLGGTPLGGSVRQFLGSRLWSVQIAAGALLGYIALGKFSSLHLNFCKCKMFPVWIFIRIKEKNSFVAY